MSLVAVENRQTIEMVKPLKAGDIVEGTVIGIGRSAVYLDLGPQGTGIIYGREFLQEKDTLRQVQIGARLVTKIVDLENDEGYIELSLGQAGKELVWKKLNDLKATETLFKVAVVGANKGGLLATVEGMQAFLPVSQLSQEHYPKVEGGDPNQILKELQKFMGQELEVEILDLDPKEGKIILSEKSKEKSKLKELLKSYTAGDVVEGEITGIVEFGAFMKFNEVEGLIHISEIDWQIIDDPAKFLGVGEKVKAKIIDISNGRVSLSLKALKEDPWKEIEKKYKKLDVVEGKVTKLNPFGAFVEVEPKIQGLCHISEFGTKTKMEEVLKIGERHAFQVLELNPTEHRMSLRLATDASAAEPAAEPQPTPQPEHTPESQAN
ncbi:MAG: S1 RNA-binding domain-containing protein [Candidatus Wildermuthbacteria bacterium]|nr:S1 RNA-binding domain-containing protein [Candidatus Wildermuthbacteria bacterium]